MTEDEMVGWHHQLNGHEFKQALGVGDGKGSLVCCRPWDHKESHMTEHERRVFYYHSVQLSSVQFSSSVMTDSW